MNSFWWIFHKDLVTEFRARRVWPTMLLLGIVVAIVFGVQMDILPHQKQALVGGLLWLAIFFAGMTAIERSFSSEEESGCWEAMKLYPASPAAIYFAKLLASTVALGVLECVLFPLFFVLAGLSPWRYAGEMALVGIPANVGICAVGNLVSALATGIGRAGYLLVLLVLPLVIPVLLAAAEATRLAVGEQIDGVWWRWIQLLVAFAVVYVAAGTVLFEYATEE
ncbi:MAG: heme exporter protein CcmB [Planctomycetota bacterium]